MEVVPTQINVMKIIRSFTLLIALLLSSCTEQHSSQMRDGADSTHGTVVLVAYKIGSLSRIWLLNTEKNETYNIGVSGWREPAVPLGTEINVTYSEGKMIFDAEAIMRPADPSIRRPHFWYLKGHRNLWSGGIRHEM